MNKQTNGLNWLWIEIKIVYLLKYCKLFACLS